jgi:hypothetical protein
MGNTYVVANGSFCFLVGAMDNCPILNISIVANPNLVYIATDNGIKPNRAMFAQHNITNNGGIRC